MLVVSLEGGRFETDGIAPLLASFQYLSGRCSKKVPLAVFPGDVSSGESEKKVPFPAAIESFFAAL